MGAAQKQGDISELDLQHPYLKNCKTRTIDNKIDMLATIQCQLPTYKKWKEDLQAYSLSQATQQYLLLPKNHTFDEGGVCSTSGELTLQYQYYPRLLSCEIASRKSQSRKFTEGQLWYLLHALTVVKFQLSQNGQLIGDPHPRNIFLNNNGKIKIGCLRSWPGQVNNYRRAVLEQQCGYLAPQDIERLKLGAMDNQTNAQSQIFAFGVVLLSSASLQMQRDLYQMKEKLFQEQIFYSRLGKFQHDTTYSQIFRAVVSNLLEMQPLRRMTLHELHKLLEKHSENIIAKKPLRIDNAGKKLQKTISQMLKIIHPAKEKISSQKNNQATLSPELLPTPFQSSQTRVADILGKHQIQTNVRQSSRFSRQKANLEEKCHSQNKINIPPKPSLNENINEMKRVVNPLNPTIPNNESFVPVIKRAFSSQIPPPIIKKIQSITLQNIMYKPKEPIITQQFSMNKSQAIKTEKEAKQTKAIEQSKVAQRLQNPTITQIWNNSQTSIGQLNLLIQTKPQGFGRNSLITPNYHPECIEPPALESIIPMVEKQLSKSYSHQKLSSRPLEKQSENMKQQSSYYHSQSLKNENWIPTNFNSQTMSKPNYIVSDEFLQQSPKQIKQSKQQMLKQQKQLPQLNHLGTRTEQIQIIRQQVPVEAKRNHKECNHQQQEINRKMQQLRQRFHLQQLEIQIEPNQNLKKQILQIQATELASNHKSLTPTVKLWGLKPNIVTQNIPSSLNTTNIKQLQAKDLQSHKQIIHQLTNKPNQTQVQYVQKAKQPSKKQQTQHSNSPITKISLHSLKDSATRYRQQIIEQQSQIIQYHTYVQIVTSGSFQECWQQILILLKDPTEYSTLIDPQKVKVRILEDQWSLKVGPGVFDILLNKEQGKFLLKNWVKESRCVGQMLGGVYKDEEKQHRIWFNSAYYYKGKTIPSRKIIQECLRKCKQNIERTKE